MAWHWDEPRTVLKTSYQIFIFKSVTKDGYTMELTNFPICNKKATLFDWKMRSQK